MAKTVAQSEKDWEAENACDTLIRAEEIRNKPALLKKAMGVMEKRQKALNEVMEMSTGTRTRMKRRNMI
uniref:Uncharacterized protein n=1 Tax=viral metagenome TaxID=1070528 RepID=A0A6M3KEE2_9ZZZZ